MYFSSALKQFGNLLYESDDAQTHNIAAQLDLQGVAVSQYIREAYEHKERKGHPQIAWKLEETVLIL